MSQTGNRRSLNRDARKRELMKITKENQLILKRLQDKTANYNVSKWQREDNERIKILKNICEFPLIYKDTYMQQPEFIIKKKKSSSAHTGGIYKKKGYSSHQPMTSSNPNQIIKKETLYSGNHELGNGLYNVQILLSMTDDLVISAQHTEQPDSFIIDIEASKVNHLVTEFGNDFENMASHLKIMNKRMVLLNPVSFLHFPDFAPEIC